MKPRLVPIKVLHRNNCILIEVFFPPSNENKE